MAVVNLPSIHSRPKLWETGDDEALLSSFPNDVGLNMSYGYPSIPPPPGESGLEMAPSRCNPPYRIQLQGAVAAELDGKESDESYEEHSMHSGLRRCFSTPNAAQTSQQATTESQPQPGASGEKKRNKLGYHRTSIACSHCRRRKIRCIASPDVQNRCVNCIRLKKECSFYPVDQQPGSEPRSRVSSRPTVGSSVASTTSSPAVAGVSPAEMPPHQMLPHMPCLPAGGAGKAAGDEYFAPEAKVPSNGLPANHFGFATQASAGWYSTDTSSTPLSKPDSISVPWQSYPAESPLSAQFSPFTQPSTAPTTWTSGNSETGSHEETSWTDFTPSARSMSYSGESTGSHQQLHYLPVGQSQHLERRLSNFSDIYSQPLGAPVANMTPNSGPAVDAQATLVDETAFCDWQYDKPTESQDLWLEEQQPQSQAAGTQAPPVLRYSA